MPNSKSNHNNTNSVISKPNAHTNLQAARLSKVSTSVNTNHSVDNQDVTMQNSTSENWILAQSKKNATKRNLSSSSSEPNSQKTQPNKKLFFTSNHFEVLSQDELEPSIPTKPTLSTSNEPNQEGNISVGIKSTLPPPIFVKGVICFTDLCSELIELIGVDNFSCKSSTDRLKIMTTNPASYRTLIHFLKDQKAEYYTYQLKEDKPTRVVIRNLHPSTSTELIKTELELRLFEVRQVTNVLHKINKHPIPLFFVDPEPTIQSNDIYKLTSLIHTKIKVEEPYKSKTISQCINCQDYGHTKSYCGYPARYVRCGALHSSSACPNPRDATPKFALCSGDHPSNYKGCSVYKDLQHRNKPKKGKLLSDNFIHKKNVQYSNVTPSVPEHIRFLISNKRRARAAYQRLRLPSHKRIFNNLSNSLKKILAKHKNQSFANHLSNLSPNNGSLWTATKSLLKYKPSLVPIINPRGGFASTDVEKAELFKEHLTETFTPHLDIQIPSQTDIVNRLLDIPPSIPPEVKHFSPGEVKFAIQKYSLKKSPGFDLITAEVARLSYFPILWKFSVTILVPKPNKPPDISSSYRPISLLPFFSKILERLILERILPYISSSSILPNTQFGFRSAHSSIHQLHRLVRVGTSFSELAKISAGVPQRGILSPLLYNIYAADQPTSPYTTVAEFADDKAIISIHDNPHIASLQLQHHLDLMAVCSGAMPKNPTLIKFKPSKTTSFVKSQILLPISQTKPYTPI
ncbi:hypothetical protein QTP88_024727 [Uroleucon formosanum]